MSQIPLASIPDNWKIERLDRLFQIRNEPARIDDPPVSAFIDGTVTLRSNRPDAIIKGSGQEIGYKHIEIGDLVISGMNAHLGGLGISDSSGKCTPVYTVLKKTSDLDSRFISYYLWHAAKSGYIKSLVNAVRYNSADFGPETIKRFMVPVPPIAEQRKIANYLEETNIALDQSISASKKLLALSEEVLISRINSLFADEPTPDFLLGRNGNALSLFRAGIRGQAGNTPKSSESTFWTTSGNGTPWLSIGDMVSREWVQNSEKDVTSIGLAEIAMSPNKEEVLLFAMYASMGKVSFAPPGYVWSQAILGLSTGPIDKYFLAAWFEIARPSLKALARSSTQDNLNADQVMSLRIPDIDRSEQEKIGQKYRALLKEFSSQYSLLSKQIELLKELQTSIVASAVTGGIAVDSISKEES